MASPEHYGSRYWCITGEGDPLYLYADCVVTGPTGELVAWGGYRSDVKSPKPDGDTQALYAIAAGQWHTFYAASQISGEMVCAPPEAEQDFPRPIQRHIVKNAGFGRQLEAAK